jgi:DNA-binding transcriptional ArsR family regulator
MVARNVVDTLFRMLADPTRRHILDVLVNRGERTVSELADVFPQLVTSGISKHLMVLRAAGLVHSTRQGRRQLYRAKAEAITTVLAPWLAKYEQYWGGALERLRDLAEDSTAKASLSRPGPARHTNRRDMTRAKIARSRNQAKGRRPTG